MKKFGATLKLVRKSRGYTLDELATAYNKRYRAGLNKGTLSKYENGKQEPMISVVDNLATLLNVGTDYLIGKEPIQKSVKGISIPVLGSVIAGIPIEAMEDILGYEEISTELANTGDFFALQIKGDSMSPVLSNKDIVVVKCQSDVENGDIVIAMVNGHDACCKKLVKYDGGISLVSLNPNYEPLIFSIEQVESTPVNIIGKVIESRRKF